MSSGDGEPESGEVVTPVEKFLSDLRPSTLPAVRLLRARSTRQIWVRTAPVFSPHAAASASVKINNYNGITSAKGEGMALPATYEQKVSAARVQTAQVDTVKGADARGIPPRGKPV